MDDEPTTYNPDEDTIAALSKRIDVTYALIGVVEQRLTDRINDIARSRRFSIATDRSPSSAHDYLGRILSLLDSVSNHTMALSELRLHVNRNKIKDAIELGVSREPPELVRGVILNGSKGQPPQVIALAEHPRPRRYVDGSPILWEDDPAPPERKKRRSPTKPRDRAIAPTFNIETGRWNAPKVKTRLAGTVLDPDICRHFPSGIGHCREDCLSLFGSVYGAPAEPCACDCHFSPHNRAQDLPCNICADVYHKFTPQPPDEPALCTCGHAQEDHADDLDCVGPSDTDPSGFCPCERYEAQA